MKKKYRWENGKLIEITREQYGFKGLKEIDCIFTKYAEYMKQEILKKYRFKNDNIGKSNKES